MTAPPGAPPGMRLVLGLDTATTATVVAAVSRDGETLAERFEGAGADGRPQHTSILLALVEAVVDEAGGWDAVDLIACGVGPGSFTGVRVGVATARALAQGHELPVVGVPTTSVLAATLGQGSEGRVCVGVVDARRGEIFAQIAGADEPFLVAPEGLGEALAERGSEPVACVAAGEGALRYRDVLEAQEIEVPGPADPLHTVSGPTLCRLATRVASEAPVSAATHGPDTLSPLYLRRPDAERWGGGDGR